MTDIAGTGPAQTVRDGGEKVVQSTGFESLSRAGFVARGLIYGIIGVLALRLAIGQGGRTTNQQGALHTVAHQPFGKVLLALLAIGLGGYAMWRFTRAAIGHGPEGRDSSLDRVTALASGIVYFGFFIVAVRILTGSRGSSRTPATASRDVFGWPAGTWIVGIAGVIVIGVGLYQGYRGVTREFLDDSKVEQMSVRTKRWITALGVIGHLSRMIVFTLVGVFLVKAAVDYNARAAVGLDGALAKLQHNSFGPFLLGLVALGLIAFALYSFSDARYRRI